MRKLMLFVALGVLAWIFVVPSCSTKFGCESAPVTAHADDGECPDSAAVAGRDAAWAAARMESIKDKPPTVGLYYDEDGTEHPFTSGRDDDADMAVEVGRDAGVFPRVGSPIVVDHVEVKVAAAMRKAGESEGVLVINNRDGVCRADNAPQPASCRSIVPRLLPDGATLVVWWPGSDGPASTTFTGG